MCWKCDELNEEHAKDPDIRKKELERRGASVAVDLAKSAKSKLAAEATTEVKE